MQKLLRFVLFSNLFYCLCAIALVIETALVFELRNIPFLFWPLLAVAIFLYYGYAYWKSASNTGNVRSQWYYYNKVIITRLLYFGAGLILLLGATLLLVFKIWPSINHFIWLLSIAITAVGYYGVYYKSKKYSLRSITLLKPIIIGYVWSGAVVALPAIVNIMFSGKIGGVVSLPHYFLDTWILISLLALLFDIKDFEEDENFALQTLVTKFGIEKTIMKIVNPGFFLFSCSYLFLNYGYTLQSLVIALIAFCLTAIAVALGVLRKQNIVYYLLVIDGLMLFKALIGITLNLVN